ncbi:MAG: DUF429 domain-containing protein [Gammaproteobacteria bacterium]|nr:DUF429 domain-containing protein [Gammaproteobacteria bacterium]
MKYIGIDGCKAGWFYIGLDDAEYQIGIFPCILELSPFLPSAKRVLVDIPIGLNRDDQHERQCDVLARNCLKPYRHASVFPAPSRCALEYRDYQQANEANRACTGRGLSRQTFNIMSKIREVDDFLQKEPQRNKVMECHPELGFWAINNKQAMRHNKKTQQGFEERLALLVKHFHRAEEIINQAMSRYLRQQVLRDDIVDALICAVSAKNAMDLISLPVKSVYDEELLPMQIVYWQPDE